MLLYEDTVDFEFSEKGHRYTVSKRVEDVWLTATPVTGITTITSIIAKDALVMWSAKVAAEYMRDNFVDKKGLPALVMLAKNAHKDEKTKAGGIGTVGHKMIEALLLGKEVVMPEREELKVALENIRIQHEAFEAELEPATIHVEKPMYSLTHDFAGTDDRLCTIGEKTVLIDYKTANRSYYNPDGIYASNFAQLGGQAILVEEQEGIEVDEAAIVNFAKDSQEFKMKSLSDMGLTILDAKLYFLACLNLYNLNKLFEWRMK